MASSTTLTTVTSPTTTLDALTQHDHGKPSHSDKIAIIGLTVGMALLFLLFIAPCCCLQYLAHRQQKKEQNAEARIRHPNGSQESSTGLADNIKSSSTATMTNTIHRRMSDTSVVIAIAISCTVIVVIFLSAVSFCNWRSRPKSPSTRGREHDDSDANSDIELDAMPDGALNHPLVRGSNGAGHVYPVFEATRERHAQN
ncbi:hypothetical protein FMUND_11300 [Fusarium mundagurra]|uniref:Uncharacterized protein n=1 Tax=Fusarium mundagurra TaxID=1567541 RepID=A0A8H5Y8K7_9HYPO|nr:hypothetical protein FMUND_11300 [Fusarium mundagurra]